MEAVNRGLNMLYSAVVLDDKLHESAIINQESGKVYSGGPLDTVCVCVCV